MRLLTLGFTQTSVLGGDELEQAQGTALNLQGGGCAGFEHVLQHGLGESDGGAGLCGEDSHELPEACPVFCVGGLQIGVDGVERSRVECAEIAGQAA